jgi:8-oxo-dGTP pyrophosphatase MutT (NUDIX family)
MRIFIGDIPVNIVSTEEMLDFGQYDQILKGDHTCPDFKCLSQDVLITEADAALIDAFLVQVKSNGHKQLEEITFTVNKYKSTIRHIKSEYKIVKAAGGLVVHGGKVLMIYRLKKWDLPKGKLDPGESAKVGAVREVQEECNIEVTLRRKVCNTWHTYKRNGEKILKKTTWYLMYLEDDSAMRPQVEENIEIVRWMDFKQVKEALYDSYASIRYVFKRYFLTI